MCQYAGNGKKRNIKGKLGDKKQLLELQICCFNIQSVTFLLL